MWVKIYADGTTITENKPHGHTWMRTPLNNIIEVYMINNNGDKSPSLTGYQSYWHSRTNTILNSNQKSFISEQIQGLRDDGQWDTIKWDARTQKYTHCILKTALGKPSVPIYQ